MKKICLIGNNGVLSSDKGGQTAKVRLYQKIIEKEKLPYLFVNLDKFLIRFPYVIFNIVKGFFACETIVLLTAERGCKYILPFCVFINIFFRKRLVFPMIGGNLFHSYIKRITNSDQLNFYCGMYRLPKKRVKIWIFKKINIILPETLLYKDLLSFYFGLNKLAVLTNFRDSPLYSIDNTCSNHSVLKIVFFSRIMKLKGIFDLLDIVSLINKERVNIRLDIYGEDNLNPDEHSLFMDHLNAYVNYKGCVDDECSISTLTRYDLFVFPTRAPYEGVPGVISESLIAGTPILTSNFPNAKYILEDGYDSIFYEMFNVDDLKAKLEWCINNKDKIRAMRKNCLESSKKFTYEYNRKDFLKYVCGVEEE